MHRFRWLTLALALGAAAVGLGGIGTPVKAQGGLPGATSCTPEPNMVDCFKVSAATLATVQSKELTPGVYRVVSIGAWQNATPGGAVLVDAECADNAGVGFLRGDDGVADRLDLKIDGAAPTWIPTTPTIAGCSPADKRFDTYVHVATTRRLALAIDDDDPTGNAGNLEVRVYDAAGELGVPLQSVAGIVQIDPRSQTPVSVPAAKWSRAVVAVRGLYQWSIKPENQADPECAKTEGGWSATATQDDPNPIYNPYRGQDYLDVWVDGRDQHMVPPAPTPGTPNCDVVSHAYIHPGGPDPLKTKRMLVESDRVRFGVFDWAYGDNLGVLFGVVLLSEPAVNAPTTPFALLGEDAPVEPVQVPVDGTDVASGTLTAGVYELTASGVWKSGNLEVDAECSSEWLKNRFDRDRTHELGNGDLRIDGTLTEWVPVGPDGSGCASSTHTYRTYVNLTTTGVVSLDIDDIDDTAGNNSLGPITVAFRRITQVQAGASAPRPVMAVGRPTAVYGDYEYNAAVPLSGTGEHLILSEGTFRYRHYNEADAECSFAKPRAWVADQAGVDNPDVVINGVERTWAPSGTTGLDVGTEAECPMGGHERWTTVTTGAASVDARIQDTWYGDNDGALVVTAFRLG